MNELALYEEAVRRYAAEKTDYLFHNEGSDHALIICSAMFVLTKCLTPCVCSRSV